MTAKSRPPFHAEHIGSLLRPAELRKGYRDHAAGTISDAEFTAIQDKAVREVVALQEQVGLEMVTDGEFRRASYWSHFVEAVDGLEVAPSGFNFYDDQGRPQEFLAPHPVGKLKRTRTISGDEYDFLKGVTKKAIKTTMVSPPTMHFICGAPRIDTAVYPDLDAFCADLAAIFRDDIADVAARGGRYVQLDDVPFAMLCDPTIREAVTARGYDPEALTDTYIELMNASLAGRPDGVVAGMHICRGNFKGKWLSQGGYEVVAEKLFNEIDVDVFCLEYDTPRAGDFAPLKSVPDDKTVILGLVSSKVPELEDAAAIKARIDEATRFVPLERLGLSPQCGFASAVSGNPVTVEDEIAKLKLIVDVAGEVWG